MTSDVEFLNFIKTGDTESFKNSIESNPELAFAKDNHSNTALHYAARFKRLEILETLVNNLDVNNLEDLNTCNDKNKTALHLLAIHNNDTNNNTTKIIMLMLDKGAKPEIQDFDKNTPLHIALKSRRTDNAELLINHLFESNKIQSLYFKNSEGETPSSIAEKVGLSRIGDKILEPLATPRTTLAKTLTEKTVLQR